MVVTGLAIAFGLATAYTGVMAALDWRRGRRSAAFRVIAFVGAGVAIANALSLAQLLERGPDALAAIVSAQMVLSPVVIAGVMCMSLVQSDRTWRLSGTTGLLLAVAPIVMLAVTVVPAWRHLLVASVQPASALGLPMVVPGPAFWACILYGQVVLAGSVIRVLVLRRRAESAEQRRICNRVLITYLPPLVAAIAGGGTVPEVSLIPIGQALSMAYLHVAWIGSLSRHMPVAYRKIFQTISDAVTVVDPAGRIIDANPAARTLLRRFMPELPDDLATMTLSELGEFPLDEKAETAQTLSDVGGSGIDLHLQINPVRDGRNVFLGWILVGRDLTESNQRRRRAEQDTERLRQQLETIEQLQANLSEQARRDPLTGLHNRRHLIEQLHRAAGRDEISLALIDLDHFKNINDVYGHAAGDAALVHTAQLLADAVRDGDLVARYGGEEFVVVFFGVGPETAWSRIEVLRERLARTAFDLGSGSVMVTMSAGVAGTVAGCDADDLLRRADEAMYEAKRRGRNRTELFEAYQGTEAHS